MDFWGFPTLLADAKAWHVPLDRPTINTQQREYPPEQIEWYLTNSNVDYAILTNGRLWRLIPRVHDPGQPRFDTYLECDFGGLLNDKAAQKELFWPNFDDFVQFFLFFSPAAFAVLPGRVTSLIQRARTGSTYYRVGVGEGLKQRVFEALRLCIEGFLSYAPNRLNADVDLEECRSNSLVLLYRLLFVLYGEDRKLLPYGVEPTYTNNRSLGRFRDELASRLDRSAERTQPDYDRSQGNLWSDLSSLFALIDEGAPRYNVPPYNGGLFDSDSHPFLRSKVLPDWYLARIIDQLGRAEDRSHGGTELVRVDYRDLAIQHLGNLYEGLLELQPQYAPVDSFEIRSKDSEDDVRVVAATSEIPGDFEQTGRVFVKGSVYLVSDKGERKASGSYYTPDRIVDYIVQSTLGPLCEEIDRKLNSEISELRAELSTARKVKAENVADPRTRYSTIEQVDHEIQRLSGDFAERVLRVRIVDPAMGSGHFLIRACQYLAEQIATNPHSRDPLAEGLNGDESILTYWKRRVAESCLYGVDRNFMAVELAKLALWLETIAISQPLTFLDHHLRHGDSLVGASFRDLRSLPDAPPMFAREFDTQLQDTLPGLLVALSDIRQMPSLTRPQVKQKGKLFREKCEVARVPFRVLADIWCATDFLERDERLNPADYGALVEQLTKPNNFSNLSKEKKYSPAVSVSQRVNPFHWQLEFPEVFYDAAATRTDAGFDVVIGNPPYDVLSEKETGQDLSSLKQFLKRSTIYRPSFVGKNNLYKLFLCRSLSLLAEGGRLGFITPMPLLGDEQAVGLRREILKEGTFCAIEAFPQKDDPLRRVFRDAKLSTAISIILKTTSKALRNTPFMSRVHPANLIEENSPALTAKAEDIPLYDPSNLTIVSCSQADWELAVRIMQTDRLQRLDQVCESFQGEVNETTDDEFLSSKPNNGVLVLRGSNVSMYALRSASQGEALYLDFKSFLKGTGPKSKAQQSRGERIGFQRSAPQNNFRRIVSCLIPKDQFCFDTISYIPCSECRIPPALILALLNSKLLEWYFRLGSTNSKLNEYQFNNLPCPIFATPFVSAPRSRVVGALADQRFDEAIRLLSSALTAPPFDTAVSAALIYATEKIIEIEEARGDVSKRERALLAAGAQPYQVFIDRIVFAMAGLSDMEVIALEKRLAEMV